MSTGSPTGAGGGILRVLTWLAVLTGGLVLLRLAATGDLASPPLGSLDALGDWVDDREPVAVAVALVRLAAELAAWYLLALSALHVAARAVPGAGAGRVADALAVPGAARLVRAGLGLGLLAATATAGDEPAAAPPVATMERVTAPAGVATQERIGTGTATMRPLGEDPTGDPTGTASMTPVAPINDDRPDARPEPPTTWEVSPGESFWTIAADVLEAAWQRPPTDAEVDPYWRDLVKANRHRLVGDDADLILPGQRFELPAPPAPPA